MADDTPQAGTDVIATDHVTTLNGAAIVLGATTPKVIRVKAAFGDDGTARDVSAAFPLPVVVTSQPAITKGTQGTTGVTTQDLKDAGRVPITFYMVIPVLTTATDTLQSLTATKAGVTVLAATTPAVVTAGKTLRVTRFTAAYIATATSGYAMVRLRGNPAGLVTLTSPVYGNLAVGTGAPATANAADTEDATFPDGLEFAAGTGLGISVQGFAAVTATAVGYVVCSVSGYEY